MSSSNYAVRLLTIAEQDLQDLVSYVAAENVPAALGLEDKIENALKRLRSHPHLDKVPNDEKLVRLRYRVLVVESYLMFYKIHGATVLVYRILHGAQDIPTLFKDL